MVFPRALLTVRPGGPARPGHVIPAELPAAAATAHQAWVPPCRCALTWHLLPQPGPKPVFSASGAVALGEPRPLSPSPLRVSLAVCCRPISPGVCDPASPLCLDLGLGALKVPKEPEEAGRAPAGSARKGKRQHSSPQNPLLDCSLCGKVFSSASSLSKHYLTHSQERKHVCKICSKAFKRQDHLYVGDWSPEGSRGAGGGGGRESGRSWVSSLPPRPPCPARPWAVPPCVPRRGSPVLSTDACAARCQCPGTGLALPWVVTLRTRSPHMHTSVVCSWALAV